MKSAYILLVVAAAFGLISCAGRSGRVEAVEDSVAVSVMEDTEQTGPDLTRWQYETTVDEMTDKNTYIASIMSENEVEFNFPYEGGSRLFLVVRQSPQYGKDMFIKVTQGQFVNTVRGQSIKMRFDDEAPINVMCQGASDYSTDVLFLTGYNKLIGKLKASKKVRIAAEFFNEGVCTFTFNSEGLEWNH